MNRSNTTAARNDLLIGGNAMRLTTREAQLPPAFRNQAPIAPPGGAVVKGIPVTAAQLAMLRSLYRGEVPVDGK